MKYDKVIRCPEWCSSSGLQEVDGFEAPGKRLSAWRSDGVRSSRGFKSREDRVRLTWAKDGLGSTAIKTPEAWVWLLPSTWASKAGAQSSEPLVPRRSLRWNPRARTPGAHSKTSDPSNGSHRSSPRREFQVADRC